MKEWPLVGRDREVNRLRELILAPDGPGVVLTGPAGVGKSRLALHCLRLGEARDMATARVTATRSARALPLGAFAPVLSLEAMAFPEAPPDLSGLLRRAADSIIRGAEGRRLLLLVDDAHLLDDASSALVYQLCEAKSVRVLATVRSGEPAPDSVSALWKEGLVERVELTGLAADAIEELLCAVLGGPVDGATAVQLTIRSQGNILYLRELVTGAVENATLQDDGGIWRLVSPLRPSARLAELIEQRLGGLDPAERSLLEVISIAEPLGPNELVTLDAVDLAETLERKGLVASHRAGRRLVIGLAHPLYGDVLRDRVSPLRVRRITGDLADAIQATGARRHDDPLKIGTWRLEGGGGHPDLLLEAALIARWRYDFGLAERLSVAAVEAGAGFDGRLLVAQSAMLQGRAEIVEQVLDGLATEPLDDSQMVRLAHARLDYCISVGDLEQGQMLARESEAAITDPTGRDEVAARRSWLELMTQGAAACLATVEPLLDRADGRGFLWAAVAGAYALARVGRIGEALTVAAAGEAAATTANVPLEWHPAIFAVLRCEALHAGGHLREAETLATDQYDKALQEQSPESQGLFGYQLARISLERGKVRTAARHAHEAAAIFRQLGRPVAVRDCLGIAAWALALQGNVGESADAIHSMDSLQLPISAHTASDALRARAWVAATGGNVGEAREILDRAAAQGQTTGDLVGALGALHDRVRVAQANAQIDVLMALAPRVEGSLAAARAAHAQALETSTAPGLLEVSAQLETIGADLLAAEAAADAAAAWQRAGKDHASRLASARALVLSERCQGATSPSLQPVEAKLRLTPAERNAARLAADGQSNREIAGRLEISVRTVENHLQRVYEKLGISSREDLPAVFKLG